MQDYYRYDVVELIAKLQLTDSSASQTGPTFATKAIKAPGVQAISVNLNRETQILRGNGVILATESSMDQIQVQLEIAKRDPEFEALIFGMAGWKHPDGSTLVLTDESVPPAVGIWARCKKVGMNNADVVIHIPSFKADTQQMQQQQRQFATNQISGQGSFTEAKYEVFRDSVRSFESAAFFEDFRTAATPLLSSSDSTAPTITTSNITGHDVDDPIVLTASEAMNPNTVNEKTVLLKTGNVIGSGTLVPARVVLASNGTTITVTPASPLTASTNYNAYATPFCEDLAGNTIAANDGVTVATAS
ncbi:MAG: hypothetical protein E6R03_05090 [Hyphomicrobiaceae bacterium]|nr:MAG: hypothetical protein E6R03_05090 [Hyphomicrobiaceae bacterium]